MLLYVGPLFAVIYVRFWTFVYCNRGGCVVRAFISAGQRCFHGSAGVTLCLALADDLNISSGAHSSYAFIRHISTASFENFVSSRRIWWIILLFLGCMLQIFLKLIERLCGINKFITFSIFSIFTFFFLISF